MYGNPARIEGYTTADRERVVAEGPASAPVGKDRDLAGGARLITLRRADDLRGSLAAIELTDDLPFVPQRFFTVFGVPSAHVRGEHAHRLCDQVLICLAGSVTVLVDDGSQRNEVVLSDPSAAVYIPAMVWGSQFRFSSDAVLGVFASRKYEADDYIRDYAEYLALRSAALRPQPDRGGEAVGFRGGVDRGRCGAAPRPSNELREPLVGIRRCTKVRLRRRRKTQQIVRVVSIGSVATEPVAAALRPGVTRAATRKVATQTSGAASSAGTVSRRLICWAIIIPAASWLLFVLLFYVIREPASIGYDYAFYRDVGARWLADGSYYLSHQTAGPYSFTTMVDVLYPPTALFLFVPFAVLPPILLVGGPFDGRWVCRLGLSTCPPGGGAYAPPPLLAEGDKQFHVWKYGYLDGRRSRRRVSLGLASPVLDPEANTRHLRSSRAAARPWRLGLAALVGVSLLQLPLWFDYLTAMRNLSIRADYSLVSIPLLMLPIVAWAGRSRTVEGRAPGPGARGDFGLKHSATPRQSIEHALLAASPPPVTRAGSRPTGARRATGSGSTCRSFPRFACRRRRTPPSPSGPSFLRTR